jgi:hypothetical protein
MSVVGCVWLAIARVVVMSSIAFSAEKTKGSGLPQRARLAGGERLFPDLVPDRGGALGAALGRLAWP